MKNVKINNQKSAEKGLDHVQAKCRVRLITFENIINMLEEIENTFGVCGKYYKGFTVHLDYHAQKFPNAYKGIPESTQVIALYNGRGWIIEEIYRDKVNRKVCRVRKADIETQEKIVSYLEDKI